VLIGLAEVLGTSVDAILGRDAAGGLASSEVRGAAVPAYIADSATSGDWPQALLISLSDDPTLDAVTRERLDAVVRIYLALEDLCGAQKRANIPLCLPFVPSDTGVESLAQHVRQTLGIGQAVIFDYLELLENAGLRIIFFPLGQPVHSVAFYDSENSNAFLVVNDGMNVERQLFEVLKRLGSVFGYTRRHYGAGAGKVVGGLLDEIHAARKFAALFLMPAASVRETVAQLGLAPNEWTYELLLRIKHRFGVSAQAFLFRLTELGLITAELAAGLRAKIERHYSSTSFAEPDSTRRILSPNGRLGDLLLAAWRKPEARLEVLEIDAQLRRMKLKGLSPRTLVKGIRE
jgi:Zn-dependent peptidase ImmA (M78 family)